MALATQSRRVKLLENGGGGGKPPCYRCGWGGDNGEPDDPDEGDTFELVFVDPEEDLGPEFCPECGRRVAYNIYFDDDSRAPWNQGSA